MALRDASPNELTEPQESASKALVRNNANQQQRRRQQRVWLRAEHRKQSTTEAETKKTTEIRRRSQALPRAHFLLSKVHTQVSFYFVLWYN